MQGFVSVLVRDVQQRFIGIRGANLFHRHLPGGLVCGVVNPPCAVGDFPMRAALPDAFALLVEGVFAELLQEEGADCLKAGLLQPGELFFGLGGEAHFPWVFGDAFDPAALCFGNTVGVGEVGLDVEDGRAVEEVVGADVHAQAVD